MSRTETTSAGAQVPRQPRKAKQASQAPGAAKPAVKGHAATSTKRASGRARTPVSFHTQTTAALGPMANISPDQWRAMVAEAAYYRAQRRGFDGGSPEQDWYEAEEDIRRSLEER